MKSNERMRKAQIWLKDALINPIYERIGVYQDKLSYPSTSHWVNPVLLSRRHFKWGIGWATCLALAPNLSFGTASAVDGSAHHACVDTLGFINFDETKYVDGTPACYNNYSYGYANSEVRLGMGKPNATVCSSGWVNCSNSPHADITGVVYYKDSVGYFWCGVFDAATDKYLGVIAKTANGSCPIYITTAVVPAAGGVLECNPNPVEAGASTTCIAQPNVSYSFGSFASGVCSSVNGNECTLDNVAVTKTVTANFVAAKHTITTNVAPAASGRVTCNPNPVPHGTDSTCTTATTNVGYLFDNFSGACTGTTCKLINVQGPKTVTGNFHLASDPFLSKTVVLQTQAGGLVTIPGVGPGGITLYASQFIIDNFRLAAPGFATQGANLLGHYSADFHVQFLDNFGNPATHNGVTGRADLVGGIDNFQALYMARTSQTQLGQFVVKLNKATFSGNTSLNTAMVVSLANVPAAKITIGGPSNYAITYQVPFSINGQYALNGSSDQEGVPNLDAGYMVSTTANPTAGGTVTCAPNPVKQGGTSVCTATANANYRLGDFSGDCTGTTCVLSNVTGPKTVNVRFWVGPDPFLGRYVVLKTQTGGLVLLPKVGPGGADLYAREFVIDNFTLAPAGFVDSGANLIGHYSGDFHVAFLDANGNPATHNGVTGRADLVGGVDNFQVLYTNRVDQFAAGRFAMTLQVAKFVGNSNLGTSLQVELADVPNADVTLGGSPNYSVNYTTPFTIKSQYDPGTGTQTVPPLLATHPITAIALPTAGGTVVCNPNAVIQGNGSTCTATPKAGYKLAAFSGDCTGATCVFTNVTGPKTVTANFAFASDPFVGQTVILQTAPGTLATLPGVGPNGVTLYAKEFRIDNFAIDPAVEFTVSSPNLTGVYDADFHAEFLKADGTPAIQNGVAGRADLLGRVNNFKVRFVNRTSPFTSGTFDMGLELATFGGVTSAGANMVVELGTPEPTAKVTIGPAPDYVITYITPFTINGQYAMNGGTPVAVPGLTADKFDIATTITPTNSGTVACNPDPVPKGQVSNCTATANAGFRIGSVTGCGITATSNPYKTTVITANCALTATFVALPAGITVTPTTGLVTTEAGATATFTVKLNNIPTANVTFVLSSSNTAEGTIAPTSLTFTPVNWNTAQTVTVTGKDDDQIDGDKPYTISSTATTTTDASYSGTRITVSATNKDNDVASTGHGSKADVTSTWSHITAAVATFINSTISTGTLNGPPVVIAGVPSYNGLEKGVAYVRNVTANGFDLSFQEWNYLDGVHSYETCDYLMLKSGRITFTDGTIVEVGTFDLSGTNDWRTISFKAAFPSQPHLFFTMQTTNQLVSGSTTRPIVVVPRARTVTNYTFQAALFEQERFMNGDGHPTETVGYVAMYNPNNSGKLTLGGIVTPYALQKATVDNRFVPILSQRIFIEEEESVDNNIAHADETVHFLALGNRTFAQQTSNNDPNPAGLRRFGPFNPGGIPNSAKIEWGIWRNGIIGMTGTPLAPNWRTLPFANTYATPPIVVIKPVSNLDAEPGVVRIRNVTKTNAEAFYQEWKPLDGIHNTAEDVFYMVIESGTRRIPGDATSLTFKAGSITTNKLAVANQWDKVIITNPTGTLSPAVFTSVMSYNNAEAVTTRVKNVTKSGFDVAMDERELDNNGHPNETLGWIAIDDGETKFPDGRILQAFLTKVKSAMEPVILTPENTLWIRTNRFPTVLGDINSFNEPDPITLRFNSNALTETRIQLQLAEEKSKDPEVEHVLEDVGIFVGD